MYYGQNKIFGEILEFMEKEVSEDIMNQLKPMIAKYADSVKTTALNAMDKSAIQENGELKSENSRLLKRIEMLKFEKDHDISDLVKTIEQARDKKLESLSLDLCLIEEKINDFIQKELGLHQDCHEREKYKLITDLIDGLKYKSTDYALIKNHKHLDHLSVIINNIEDLIGIILPYARNKY
jgi:seryl-tRNA synthetase